MSVDPLFHHYAAVGCTVHDNQRSRSILVERTKQQVELVICGSPIEALRTISVHRATAEIGTERRAIEQDDALPIVIYDDVAGGAFGKILILELIGVHPIAAVQSVIAGATPQFIVVVPALQHIVAPVPIQYVIAGTTTQDVCEGVAIQSVVTTAAADDI
ncbi:hypothetical protein PAERUG_E15_London_28_01_14_03988 [Pseudomonas aeruginosa]|nr:hypothetical protein PAERUG_E15_London_28_01_14_03988 [Pseudomonas aeruginosa]